MSKPLVIFFTYQNLSCPFQITLKYGSAASPRASHKPTVILSGAPRGLRRRCWKNGGGWCEACGAAHGKKGRWSVGERFFCRRACRTEKIGGPSTARRPTHPHTPLFFHLRRSRAALRSG